MPGKDTKRRVYRKGIVSPDPRAVAKAEWQTFVENVQRGTPGPIVENVAIIQHSTHGHLVVDHRRRVLAQVQWLDPNQWLDPALQLPPMTAPKRKATPQAPKRKATPQENEEEMAAALLAWTPWRAGRRQRDLFEITRSRLAKRELLTTVGLLKEAYQQLAKNNLVESRNRAKPKG